ncbi:universal stress protein [Fulvivirga lutimaris]|uniref:universal stress protein n=1 Tax=Fulvivirga lutimaris TaxID=1819566 RepID=UPI0012BBD657|nr:universal stress protein [Fulvivirga lutimaris]MTI41066.1 universal stress protein [Fulvivirga lutimaris]
MFPIKRVLVGLDLTDMDDQLIAYTSYLTKILDIDAIYFYHVAPSLEIPDAVLKEFPALLAPADESLEKIIQDKLDQHLKCPEGTQIKIEIREGNAEDKILKWSDIKEIDLIITGRKDGLKGSGLLPGRLAKLAHCSILMVPEKASTKISKIMVPVDFSRSSKEAIKEAQLFSEKTGAKIALQNTYTVPSGYHRIGKTFEEFSEIMRGHAKSHALEFVKETELNEADTELIITLDNDEQPADKINEDAQKFSCDLIIMTSKGRTGLASVLLGSVADKVLSMKGNIPVLIIKNKKHNLGFLDALLRL